MWTWLKKWWKLVVGSVVSTVIVGLGAFIAIGEYKRRSATLADTVAVEQAKQKVAELQGRRAELLEQDVTNEIEISRIDAELEVNKKQIEQIRLRANVPAEDLAHELALLGY